MTNLLQELPVSIESFVSLNKRVTKRTGKKIAGSTCDMKRILPTLGNSAWRDRGLSMENQAQNEQNLVQDEQRNIADKISAAGWGLFFILDRS